MRDVSSEEADKRLVQLESALSLQKDIKQDYLAMAILKEEITELEQDVKDIKQLEAVKAEAERQMNRKEEQAVPPKERNWMLQSRRSTPSCKRHWLPKSTKIAMI